MWSNEREKNVTSQDMNDKKSFAGEKTKGVKKMVEGKGGNLWAHVGINSSSHTLIL